MISTAMVMNNDHSETMKNDPGMESNAITIHSIAFMDDTEHAPGIHASVGITSAVMIEITELVIITVINGIRMMDAMIPIGHTIPKWWSTSGVEVNQAITPHETMSLVNRAFIDLENSDSPGIFGMKRDMYGVSVINEATTTNVS